MAKHAKRLRPDQRPKSPRPTPRHGLTAAEEAAAAAFEATLNPTKQPARPAVAAQAIGSRAASAQRLAAEIAEELPVVRRDLRRIALTYGAMLALLAIIWIAANAVGLLAA